MARITVNDCLKKIPNRFDMTLIAANRARQIANGATVNTATRVVSYHNTHVEPEDDRPCVIALREVEAGKIGYELLHNTIVKQQ